MTYRFGKWPKYFRNGLDKWGTSKVFEKLLHYVENVLRISQTA